jgi:signal transduction histidine kinase
MGTDASPPAAGEQRRLERMLAETRQELAHSHRDLLGFASILANDLLEPLRTIRAVTERLPGTLRHRPDDAREALERIQSSTAQMQLLIQDLLTLARAGAVAYQRQRVDLQALAESVRGDLETRIRVANGKVTIERLPTVEADDTQLRQLFEQLIDNALKFQPPGKAPWVQVHAERVPASGGDAPEPPVWQITVEDNGIGFDPRYAERIFHPFERLHGQGRGGSGIGLTICRRIVERHHGTIRALGDVGQGAKFIFTLPE